MFSKILQGPENGEYISEEELKEDANQNIRADLEENTAFR